MERKTRGEVPLSQPHRTGTDLSLPRPCGCRPWSPAGARLPASCWKVALQPLPYVLLGGNSRTQATRAELSYPHAPASGSRSRACVRVSRMRLRQVSLTRLRQGLAHAPASGSHACACVRSRSRACVRVSLTRLCQDLLHEPWVLPHRPVAAPASVRPLADLGELGVRESRIFILYCWLESNTA